MNMTKEEILRGVDSYVLRERSPHSWQEDFNHKNGNYENSCSTCQSLFIGHKRRVTCKVCAMNALRAERDQLKAREKACETMDQAQKLALLRALQECGATLGLTDPTAAQLVEAVAVLKERAARATKFADHLSAVVEVVDNHRLNARFLLELELALGSFERWRKEQTNTQ